VTCPDWRSLSSRRDRDPDAWERGLEHFDGCRRCRDLALAAEPTLLFRRLPAPAVGGDEIAAMKQAVAVLRRSSGRRPGTLRRRRQVPAMLRAAALAALAIGAAALQGTGTAPGVFGAGETVVADETLSGETLSGETLSGETLSGETLSGETLSGETLAELAPRPWLPTDRDRTWEDETLSVEDLPLVEAVDPSYGSVVQVVDDEISLVLLLPNDV
jgi:hypothetical protein